eukprot:177965-Pyramimonas_sp.AAC.2
MQTQHELGRVGSSKADASSLLAVSGVVQELRNAVTALQAKAAEEVCPQSEARTLEALQRRPAREKEERLDTQEVEAMLREAVGTEAATLREELRAVEESACAGHHALQVEVEQQRAGLSGLIVSVDELAASQAGLTASAGRLTDSQESLTASVGQLTASQGELRVWGEHFGSAMERTEQRRAEAEAEAAALSERVVALERGAEQGRDGDAEAEALRQVTTCDFDAGQGNATRDPRARR